MRNNHFKYAFCAGLALLAVCACGVFQQQTAGFLASSIVLLGIQRAGRVLGLELGRTLLVQGYVQRGTIDSFTPTMAPYRPDYRYQAEQYQ